MPGRAKTKNGSIVPITAPMKAFIVKRALHLTPGAILDELTKSPEFSDLNWKNKPCEWAIRRHITVQDFPSITGKTRPGKVQKTMVD